MIRTNPMTARQIIAATADLCGITPDDILGKSRAQKYALPRQVAMHLTRKHTDMSYPQIAREFQRKDHGTIIHADRKIAGLVELARKGKDI